jgi:hypothetical protein
MLILHTWEPMKNYNPNPMSNCSVKRRKIQKITWYEVQNNKKPSQETTP